MREILPGALPPLPGEATNVSDTISDVVTRFQQVKAKSGAWVGKTSTEYHRVLELFCSLVGGKRPIGSLLDEDIRLFRDAVITLPPNYTKLNQFAGKTASEVLESMKPAIEKSGLAAKTTKKYLSMLRAFLFWAADEGYLQKVPGLKVKISAKINAQDARSPFANDQLKKLFNSPQYTGHRSSSKRSKPGSLIVKDGKFWIPLVGLFTGMRLGEIVQLLATDIREEHDVSFFNVRGGEDEDNLGGKALDGRLCQ